MKCFIWCLIMCCLACRYALEGISTFAETVGERVLHTPCNPISIAMTISQGNPHPQKAADRLCKSLPSVQGSSDISSCSLSREQAEGRHESRIVMQSQDSADEPHEKICSPSLCRPELGRQVSDSAASSALSRLMVQPADEGAVQTVSEKSLSMLGSMLFKRGVSGTRVVAQGKVQSIAGHSFQGYGAHYDCYPHTYLTFAAALGTTRQDVDEFLKRLRTCLHEFRRAA